EEDRQTRAERLSFSSAVIRDVLYGYLSRRRRKSLHRKIAEFLESEGRGHRADSLLLHHYVEADVPEKVVEYGLRLSRLALDAFGAEEALRAARTVLEFIDEDIPDYRAVEAEARTILSTAYRMSGNMESSLQEIERVIRMHETDQRMDQWLQAVAL